MISATIPAEFEPFVRDQLAMGHYQSAEDVVSDALRLLREKNVEAMRMEIQVGIDQLDRGEGITIEDEEGFDRFFDDIEKEARAELDAERLG